MNVEEIILLRYYAAKQLLEGKLSERHYEMCLGKSELVVEDRPIAFFVFYGPNSDASTGNISTYEVWVLNKGDKTEKEVRERKISNSELELLKNDFCLKLGPPMSVSDILRTCYN